MKDNCNLSLAWLCITVATILILLSCGTDHEAEIRELHHKYMEASMNHNIEILSVMTAEDIVWQLGPFILRGKEEALGPHKYDEGTNCILEYSNVVIHGDTVEFMLDEKNEVITAVGMTRIRTFPRFIFKDGLVYKKEEWKPSTDREEYNERAQPMRSWIRTEHPEAIKRLFNSKGNWVFSSKNGQLMVQLAKQWQEENRNESNKPHGENR